MLGEQIRNIRKSRDFTLKALAEQTGLFPLAIYPR